MSCTKDEKTHFFFFFFLGGGGGGVFFFSCQKKKKPPFFFFFFLGGGGEGTFVVCNYIHHVFFWGGLDVNTLHTNGVFFFTNISKTFFAPNNAQK